MFDTRDQVIRDFTAHMCRLKGWTFPPEASDLGSFNTAVIDLLHNELAGIGIKDLEIDIKQNDSLFVQLAKMTALMEVSGTWSDFEKLRNNRTTIGVTTLLSEEPESDFDKVLKGLLKVPKPDKKGVSGLT